MQAVGAFRQRQTSQPVVHETRMLGSFEAFEMHRLAGKEHLLDNVRCRGRLEFGMGAVNEKAEQQMQRRENLGAGVSVMMPAPAVGFALQYHQVGWAQDIQ